MSLIVQKYGGTSVGSPEKIKAVAERVLGYSRKGHGIVVVLSAMSGETDRLIGLANSMQDQLDSRGRREGAEWAQEWGNLETLHAIEQMIDANSQGVPWSQQISELEELVDTSFFDSVRNHPYYEDYMFGFAAGAVDAYMEALKEI